MSHNVGDTVTLDGIECLIIYDNGSEAEWGRYLCVDKNHDISYYLAGSDFVDEDTNAPNGTNCINPDYKYGYEWGGYGTTTGINDTSIGAGLTNTNSLIGMNLQPDTSGWFVVWDKVEEFRETYGDKWFVPSKDELNLIYENRNNLSNLSLTTEPCYWSSSEYRSSSSVYSSNNAWGQYFHNGGPASERKCNQNYRVRLCRYTTDSELDNPYEKKTWTTNEIITAIELNRIENRINELYSSYEPHEWSDGEVITSERLNSIETQLGTDKTWEDNEIIKAENLNAIEDALVNI